MELTIVEHPLLELEGFVTSFPHPLKEIGTDGALSDLLRLDAPVPFVEPLRSLDVSRTVRDLLRGSGF